MRGLRRGRCYSGPRMAENRNKDTADGSPTLAEQLEALSPSPNLAKLLEEINGNSTVGEILKQQETAAARISEQLRASSAAAEWVHSQDSAAARIREQLAASLNFEPAYQDALSAIAESVSKTTSELARAAEFSRASAGLAEAMRAAEQWRIQVPRFEFPALPELNFPVLTEIDWAATIQSMKSGVIRMADRGWTAPGWMMPREAAAMETATEAEIDAYFKENYLGDGPNQSQLQASSEQLLNSPALEQWRDLLSEVFDSMALGKYKICVPSLVSILEGFLAASLAKHASAPKRDIQVVVTLKRAKWHETGDFTAVFWISVVNFLTHLFASAPFDSPRPDFINRHWILHGRSATDWTETDALKLINALTTLEWLFD